MKPNLENRILELASNVNNVIEGLPSTLYLNTLKKQIVRSVTSSALNYGEALAAASMRDFIYKMSIVLKEIKETKMCLILLKNAAPSAFTNRLQDLFNETDELASIIYSSIRTSKNNLLRKRSP
jgi:four helix bundle protein